MNRELIELKNRKKAQDVFKYSKTVSRHSTEKLLDIHKSFLRSPFECDDADSVFEANELVLLERGVGLDLLPDEWK